MKLRKKLKRLAKRINGYEETIKNVSNQQAFTKPGSLNK